MKPQLQTVGDIAKAEGVRASRVAYAIDVYRIAPTQRAGILRLFDEAGVDAIRSALRRIESRRQADAAPVLPHVML
jgi:hypothetical protein